MHPLLALLLCWTAFSQNGCINHQQRRSTREPLARALPLYQPTQATAGLSQRKRAYLRLRATANEGNAFVGGQLASLNAVIDHLEQNGAHEQAKAARSVQHKLQGLALADLALEIRSGEGRSLPRVMLLRQGLAVIESNEWNAMANTFSAFNRRMARALKLPADAQVSLTGLHALPGPCGQFDLQDLGATESSEEWLPVYDAVYADRSFSIGGAIVDAMTLMAYMRAQGEPTLAQEIAANMREHSGMLAFGELESAHAHTLEKFRQSLLRRLAQRAAQGSATRAKP